MQTFPGSQFKLLIWLIAFISISVSASVKDQTFEIIGLIDKVPFEEILENDTITGKHLLSLLNIEKNHPAVNIDYEWTIDKLNNTNLVFHNENERWVLKTYPMNDGQQLLLVNTQLGNHQQSHQFNFYIFDKDKNTISTRIDENRYLPEIKENELLKKANQFSGNVQGRAFLYMSDNGNIEAEAWTWMETRWMEKHPDYRIIFKWNGEAFVKTKLPF